MQRAVATLAAQSLPAPRPIKVAPSSKHGPAVKCIQSDGDVEQWKQGKAHAELVLFVARLCESAVGKATRTLERPSKINDDAVDRIWLALDEVQQWAFEIEPLKNAQRFGNLAFRKWGERLEQRCDQLHEILLGSTDMNPFASELGSYFLGSFGSWQRLDYGSGHELAFAAWLSFLQRLGLFDDSKSACSSSSTSEPSAGEERLAIEIIPKYLEVVWTLQDRYSLEPAGSHGVWGLDDYQFIPYAIGAAQLRGQAEYTPLAITSPSHKPQPSPMPAHELLKFTPSTSPLPQSTSQRMAASASAMPGPPFANLFTTSIARIHSLKRGPFHEHSPILHDVATTVPNWVKVHSGMMKMWQAECLGKRPVVQHFPFGANAFVWQGQIPVGRPIVQENKSTSGERTLPQAPTAAPWASTGRPQAIQPPTRAPWQRDTRS